MPGWWFSRISWMGKLHLGLGVPRGPGGRKHSLLFPQGDSSPKIRKLHWERTTGAPMWSERGDWNWSFSPGEDDLVARCACQQAGPHHLVRWWGVSSCDQGDRIPGSDSAVDGTQKADPPEHLSEIQPMGWFYCYLDFNEFSPWKYLLKEVSDGLSVCEYTVILEPSVLCTVCSII